MLYSSTLDSDVVAYARQASEMKVLIKLQGKQPIVATIEVAEFRQFHDFGIGDKENYFLIGFNTDIFHQLKKALRERVTVKFVLKYSYFDRLHKALDQVPEKVITRITSPSSQHFSSHKKLLHAVNQTSITLDHLQNHALELILNCDSAKAPVVVVGSFGTGKTRLLACAAINILQNEHTRVLVCAHHNASVDSFVENYFGPRYCYGNSRKKVMFVRLIFSTRYRPKDDSKFKGCYQTAYYIKSTGTWKSTRLIVTTLSTSLHLTTLVEKGFFTHILIDEAAQAREPESIAPLSLADKNTKIVIAGDHKQVSEHFFVTCRYHDNADGYRVVMIL